ncbi:MAG TPA: hypothetical protein DCQ64_32425 [Candidatus Rokubacteria bacterium]|nr:hypothetical protein [Candidatus Rokubacteria bacterium]
MSASLNGEVKRALPPIVVDLGRGCYAWIGGGHGFILDTRGSGVWQPMADVPHFGGHVLTASRVASLAAAYGRPVLS